MAEILIVDDDEVIRDTLYDLLSQNHRCQTAETAEAALTHLNSQSFDLLLTDISLPGLSGRELLSIVLERYPLTPVIVVSGLSDQGQAQALMKLGAFDYLLKPFRLEVVESSVSRAIETRAHRSGHVEGADWNIVKN